MSCRGPAKPGPAAQRRAPAVLASPGPPKGRRCQRIPPACRPPPPRSCGDDEGESTRDGPGAQAAPAPPPPRARAAPPRGRRRRQVLFGMPRVTKCRRSGTVWMARKGGRRTWAARRAMRKPAAR